jgi:alkylresorcinol/alkylpyrone synthase
MSRIAFAHTALPKNVYNQDELIGAFRELWAEKFFNTDRLEQFHRNVMVGQRHLALPIEQYRKLSGFGATNSAYIDAAVELSERLLRELFEKTGFDPRTLNALISTSVTGIMVPSIDARLMNRLPLPASLKRMPLFGLGCMGGAAGIARAADYLRGHPKDSVVFLSVELCSLTLQREDFSVANIVSSGLFGDGAAAVLMLGDEHPMAGRITPGMPEKAFRSPTILSNRSIFFPNTERVMGWDIVDSGFQVVLDSSVPEFAEKNLRPGVEAFLKEQGLSLSDIEVWIAHPGGPKVITGMEKGLSLREGTLKLSNESLLKYGNMSSASVLFILKETLDQNPPEKKLGLLLAMGPAFAAEAVLLRW